MASTIIRKRFGTLPDGSPVDAFRLCGAGRVEAVILTYGASVQSLTVPDRTGLTDDIVLGHDDLADYVETRNCFGASVGRYANRIAGARFSLDGRSFDLEPNDGPNSLHGGRDGFDRRNWNVEEVVEGPEPALTLGLASPDGDQGFPGRLVVRLTYRLMREDALAITFEAGTDRPTPVNLTHHGYFNLRGAADPGDVLGHVLTIPAERYLPVDPGAIPDGGPASVADTPFDFRAPTAIGARIREGHPQLRRTKGYDHCYCLGEAALPEPVLAARVVEPGSGRVMELLTDQPGLQLYTGNNLDGSVAGKGGRLHRQTDALCLEPEIWPDAPNRPDFPSARLDPGRTYRHRTILRFSTAP